MATPSTPPTASSSKTRKGSIEVGKAADFTLIDGDILNTPGEKIRDLSVSMTVIDGEILYQAGAL